MNPQAEVNQGALEMDRIDVLDRTPDIYLP